MIKWLRQLWCDLWYVDEGQLDYIDENIPDQFYWGDR